ncbi:hypothetical protein KBK19_04920 [Microvirga sp. STR05]|uniref:site-specific DNA-methyltransferase (adenine-specific) n=1 Tax=Hymenobacter duratus TaxID=2771356 RepID=A0ABR8JE95_9BACT|nr:DNA methyltransferase [Hymenobacter duratus]MBD2714372.1 restriction endonuclease [Hymenobacter duratus]MBR7949275.1 hypothetical protein [Microvirga sp. STR05]
MRFPTIRIEGSILSADILDKLEQAEPAGQRPTDFGLPATVKVKDEIVRAWTDLQDLWRVYKRQMDNVPADKSGVTETRRYWIVPLLGLLGYNAELVREAPRLDDKTYPISHADTSRGNLPIHVMGFHDSLDSKRETGGPRLSPHALVQEYLNLTEHLYGLVTNGLRLRLLRDSSRLVRLSFVEFDLERMFEEDHFADFAVLYRLLHATRLPKAEGEGPASLIEQYHQDALESGSRIREGLSAAVKNCLLLFGNGFVQHPDNEELRAQLASGHLTAKQYHHALLRLVYRLLFLLVTEERDLLFPLAANPAHREVYRNYYSLTRLRQLCEKDYLLQDDRFSDLWQGLCNTFRLFESEQQGRALSIAPLAGELFGSRALSFATPTPVALTTCQLPNKVLLECLRSLTVFYHAQSRQLIRVNYGALDVEEFGSVYEGLLEFDAVVMQLSTGWQYRLEEGTGRSASGSHYTPEALVQPLIRHSLEHVITDKLTQAKAAVLAQAGITPSAGLPSTQERAHSEAIRAAQATALLSIRVCDVACGSGHMLLSAARRLAVELARVRTQEDQPSPAALRQAQREVIGQCIYGVDYNPLAVELCKVALWLEAHNPGEPLNFLDHHIRCGNAIVGLARAEDLDRGIATEAFKTLPGDEKTTAAAFRKRNKQERDIPNQATLFHEAVDAELGTLGQDFEQLRQMPDHTPAEVEAKRKAYRKLAKGPARYRLQQLADLQVAPFFIPKTPATKDHVLTDAAYRRHLTGKHAIQDIAATYATTTAVEKRFFHWFLEFPDVMEANGGFDCIIGNPPFLGGQRLSGTYGEDFLNWVKAAYAPAGSVDLVTYFFRRIFHLLRPSGFMNLISTNTIAQGGAREGGLDVILAGGGRINFAVRSMKWPGLAAVEVALVGIQKHPFFKMPFELDGKAVSQIDSYLDGSDGGNKKPNPLLQNTNKSFQGSIVLGSGFVLTPEEAKALIESEPRNVEIIQPYLNGEDLNNRPDQSPSRWVINFKNWPLRRYSKKEWDDLDSSVRKRIEERVIEGSNEAIAPPGYDLEVAADFPDVLKIIEERVKPDREKQNDLGGKKFWWNYLRPRGELYNKVRSLDKTIAVALTSKTLAFVFEPSDIVFSHATGVIATDSSADFAIIQSVFHEMWTRQYASSMKGDLRYTPSDCYQTFPFPQGCSQNNLLVIESAGSVYHEYRSQLMLNLNLGLTRAYNLLHTPNLKHEDIAKAAKIPLADSNRLEDLQQQILRLRELHKQMDEAVAAAYGWDDLALEHGFHEMDYLPENDRVRYTISPAARREVLRRLLQLNHEIHAREVAEQEALATANKKPKVRKPRTSAPKLEL